MGAFFVIFINEDWLFFVYEALYVVFGFICVYNENDTMFHVCKDVDKLLQVLCFFCMDVVQFHFFVIFFPLL